MKKIRHTGLYKGIALIIFNFISIIIFAQDSTVSTHSTTTTTIKTTSDWYNQPWVWVAGGAVFLIIVISLLRGGGSTKEVTKTTVIKDDNRTV